MKNLIEAFGVNALIGKSKGLTVQEVACMNKEMCIMFGMSESKSENTVTAWVNECINSELMVTS